MRVIKRLLAATMLWILLVPVGLIVTGAVLNQVAIVVNDGSMPVQMNDAGVMLDDKSVAIHGQVFLDKKHTLMTPDTHLKFLCDVFDLGDGLYSIGDEFIDFGQWLWTFAPYTWGCLLCLKVLTYEL